MLADAVVLNPVPAIVTVVPTGPLAGEKELITGGAIQVKPANVELPPGRVTTTTPEAPVPTVAFIVEEEVTLKESAGVPPIVTAVAPVKDVPLMVRMVPCVPMVGVNEVTVGCETKPVSEPVPPVVITVTTPGWPDGTTAVMVVDETVLYDTTGIPPILTDKTFVKLVPVMVIVEPAVAAVGANELMVGGGKKMNPALVPCPVGVITRTNPEAPLPTLALILVLETTVKEVAATSPKRTAVAPEKFKPVILMLYPLPADVGVKSLMTTGG